MSSVKPTDFAGLLRRLLDNGVEFVLVGGDFARFTGLTWQNPLGAAQRGRVTDI